MTATRRRVALVVPFLEHQGGMERVALAQAAALAGRGHPVALLTCRHLREPRRQVAPPPGVEIVALGALQRAPLLDLTWTWRGARRLRALRPEAIIAHHAPTAGVLAALGAASRSTPFAVFCHGSGANGDAAALDSLPFRAARLARLRRAEFLAVLNPEAEREWRDRGIAPQRLRRVINACDGRHFRPPTAAERAAARRELGLEGEAPVVAFHGRLHPSKRLDLLAAAVATLPGCRLLIAGEGELAPGPGVRLLGPLGDPRPLLWAADLWCLPSESEGLSMALLEAMATGLPVLVSAVPGNLEAVQDGVDGRVLGEPRVEALAALLRELLAAPAARRALGEAARDTVLRRFSPGAALQPWVDWLDALELGGPVARGRPGRPD